MSAASLASVRDNGNARRVRLANYCTATVITDVIMRVRGLFVKTAECRRHSRLNNTKVPISVTNRAGPRRRRRLTRDTRGGRRRGSHDVSDFIIILR